jgi:hypothetical protein
MANIINTEEKETLKIEETQIVRSEDFVNLYINNTRFGYSKFDIQMICARSTVSLDLSQSKIEEMAVIIMSPQHAKAMLIAMENNIRVYEAQHGEIKLPEERKPVEPPKTKFSSDKKK